MKDRDHAIVIGGSITGLLTGRVLANHFKQVTIIERDIFPQQPLDRPGVPQSRFLHIFLKRGQLILETLFPGMTAELMEQGVPVIESGSEVDFYIGEIKAPACGTGLDCLSVSRGLLDWTIRQRLSALSNVNFLQGRTVTGLLADSNNTKIAGVQVHINHNGAEKFSNDANQHNQQNSEQIFADLVVDASGKSSNAPRWLQQLGYSAPRETVVDAFIGYAHRVYQRPANYSADWQAVLVQAVPPHLTRSGILFPIEGNQWMVGLGGGDRDYPPTDEAGFLEFARSLPNPEIYNAIKSATPLSSIYLYRGNENRLREYEKLARYPEQFLVMGHAACAFNPVYAQGMTVAAMEAQILDRCLQQNSSVFGKNAENTTQQIQKQIAVPHSEAWMMATYQDYRYVSTAGKQQPPLLPLMNWYQDQILEVVSEHPEVQRVMLEVIHMLKPAIAFYQPNILWPVIKRSLQRYVRRPVQARINTVTS